jgi:hypothetical protein
MQVTLTSLKESLRAFAGIHPNWRMDSFGQIIWQDSATRFVEHSPRWNSRSTSYQNGRETLRMRWWTKWSLLHADNWVNEISTPIRRHVSRVIEMGDAEPVEYYAATRKELKFL